MWAVIAPYLIRFAISLAITLLERTGAISGVEAAGIRLGTHIIQATKVEYTYPMGVNGQTQASPVAPGSPNGNYNKG